MAGESIVSQGDIEKRAEDLQVKLADEKVAAEKPTAEEKPAAEVKPVVKEEKPVPDDPKELRKWNTRVSMEIAEVKKTVAQIAEVLNKNAKKPVDYVALAKDPAKLQAAIEAREKELIEEHQSKFNENMNQAAAEITNYESERRSRDAENYPGWVELLPIMKKLSEPRSDQPNGDPRVNFNQHPKVVLDALYELAQEVAKNDPNFKKTEVKPAVTDSKKTYSQEEFEAKVAEAKAEALKEQESNLRAENKGAGVGSMGKGGSKGKPGAVDKQVLWDMPIGDLKRAIQNASNQ
jgi:hypothetical protein